MMDIEALHALVAEWKEEAEFLTNNSVGSDIAVGNTYKECAKRLAELIDAMCDTGEKAISEYEISLLQKWYYDQYSVLKRETP